MSDVSNIDVVSRLKQAAITTTAANPALVKALLAGGGGALLGAGAASALTHKHDEEARNRTRNTSFGAGMATGMAGPQIVDALSAFTHRGGQ